ncbi:probable protein rds1 [Rhynchosporium secalis]|uniref:Probable protein rds1 n=1 Tax=Rhynchosporium secalis TaxID=38038 RepID=A0A1E1MSW5_RHYSE|nr:probable protein rds1 [Rhynchosporium secalis]
MFWKAGLAAGFIAAASALPQVGQLSDGQLQGPTSVPTPVSQMPDGQLQGPAATATSYPVVKSTPSPFGSYDYPQQPTVNSAAVSSVASYAGIPASEIPGATNAVPPVVSSQVTGVTSHGPYSGTPTTTGALSNVPKGTAIPVLPPNPTATYSPDGTLHDQMPIPYTPAGGLGTNGTEPVYRVQSDFDYQSILLGLYQEWIELDLFHHILATFSEEEFTAAGLTPSDRFLIEFMADQESGHATLLSNLLGGPGGATPQCTYNYPFQTVHEAFDFTQKLTRFGESGVWGFQAHLDSREVAQLLDQSIATEARQQMIFRQFSGLFPMPVWFETGIPQSWAWTLLAPYISSCPANSKRLVWQNFPALTALNQPNSARRNATQTGFNETTGFGPAAPSSDPPAGEGCVGNNQTGFDCSAAISQNRTIPLSYPGREVFLVWDNPGQAVGPNNSYITATSAGAPEWVLWVSQLNITYSPLTNITVRGGKNYGQTIQPDVSTYEGDPAINGTMFIALTDSNAPYTAFNLSMVNPHVAAGPFLYQAG